MLQVILLADSLTSAQAVSDMRYEEWGHAPESEDPQWWLETTLREAGRHELPVTFVAKDTSGAVLGAVGLDEYDLDERRDTTPWVTGMIVRRDHRGNGIGRALMMHLEQWAAQHHITEAWVGTDLALGFYQHCGWKLQETFTGNTGEEISVLSKRFRAYGTVG